MKIACDLASIVGNLTAPARLGFASLCSTPLDSGLVFGQAAMAWSFRIGRVSGIDVRVHASFGLVVLGGAFQFSQAHGGRGAVFGALLVCLLFFCVTLHELGHSLVAQQFGVRVREIVLLPIGGMARLLRQPKTAGQELWIALAGPLVNAVIAIGLWFFLRVHPVQLMDTRFWEDNSAHSSVRAMCHWLLLGNTMLAVFNMIPAFPMDGGRVLRALLSLGVGHVRATRVAAFVGQLIAVGLIVLSFIWHSPLQALVGLFVFIGAGQERAAVHIAEVLSDFCAGEVCDPCALRLPPNEALGAAIDHLLRSGQAHFAIMHGETLIGTLSREEALVASSKVGLDTHVSAIMKREFTRVEAKTSLAEVRAQLLETGCSTMVVYGHNAAILGVIGIEDVQRIAHLVEQLAAIGIRRVRST